eukprot:6299330-Lingulodinium_polyedra.AAC.1
MPQAVVRELGQWLVQHVELRMRGGVQHWQWAMVGMCWCAERAGIAQRFRTAPAEAAELVRQMHVRCRAEKQHMFLAWRRGEQVCKAQL